MNVSFKGQQLTIGGREFEMELPIKKAVEIADGIIFVVLNEMDGIKCMLPPGDPRIDRNVIGVDFDGKTLWRIEQSPRYNGRDGHGKEGHMINDWMLNRINPDGTVRVCSFAGNAGTIDPKTGALSDRITVK